MRLTESQRRAVQTTGLDLCVVAGAGSGKTTVLAERFLHLVLEEGARVDRVLALTFTERAAVEMRERVARRFGERGRHDLRREAAVAWIGTFHGFCARLLKENAIEAGVDPAFSVLAEAEASVLLERARQAVVDRRLAEDPASLSALARLATGREGLGEDLGRLLERCRGLDRPLAEVFEAASTPSDPASSIETLRRSLEVLRTGRASYTAAGADRAERVLLAAAALDDASLPRGETEIPGDFPDGTVAAVAKAVNLQCGGEAKENLSAVRKAAAEVQELRTGVLACPTAQALASVLADLDGAFAAQRAARGALDFHDLEREALDLLRGSPGVREEVRGRFDHLLVDEYQDTNPVQEALLGLLRTPGRLFVVGDPKQAIYGFRGADHAGFDRALEAAGKEGRVALGENFRSRPEILAFANAVLAPAFAAGGAAQVPWQALVPAAAFDDKAIPSVEVHLVESATGEDAATLRVREADLVAERLAALVPGGGAGITARDGYGRPLARALGWGDAAILLRSTTDLKVYERALAGRDIPCQVVGGRGFYEAREVVDLANLLEAVENPRRELALAAALRSPFGGLEDDALLALAEERRRRRCGLADVLLEARLRVPGLASPARRRLESFRGSFRGLLALRRRGGLAELVGRALDDPGFGLSVLLRPNGRQRSANLRKVRALARVFEGDGAGGLGEFVRAVRRLRLREERETEAPLASEDAVSLLTVHQAKGLEWPLVLIPDCGRAIPPVRDGVLVEGGEAAVSLRGPGGTERTAGWKRLAEGRKARDAAEAIRVLHVAVTRAKEHLVISAVRSRGGGGPWLRAVLGALGEEAFPADGGVREFPLPGDAPATLLLHRSGGEGPARGPRPASLLEIHRRRFAAGRGVRVRLPAAEREEIARAVASLPPPVPPADETPYLATVSALLDFEAGPGLYRRRHRIGVPDRSPPAVPEPSAPSADLGRGSALERTDGAPPAPTPPFPPRRECRPGDEDEEHGGLEAPGPHGIPRWVSGVAVHAVLGTMDFRADGDAEVRDAARRRLREELEEEPPEAAVEEIAGWVRGFLGSPLGKEAREAARRRCLHREVPFLLKREGVILRGQVDLLLRGSDGRWTVADYKAAAPPGRTGRGNADRYARQVRLYAEALRPILGRAVDRGLLVYLEDPDGPVAVDLGPAGSGGLDALLGRFARWAAGGRGGGR